VNAVVRILLVDDHSIVRAGLRAILAGQPDFEVVGECSEGQVAVQLAEELAPDVVLMDLRLIGLDGAGATELIVARTAARVLVLTTFDRDADIVRAMGAGASGYLLKDCAWSELVAGIRQVAEGGTVLNNLVASRLVRRVTHPVGELSKRELQVLTLVARGLSNPDIVRELFIGETTVKSHLVRIFQKLEVTDRTAAVTVAMGRGLLDSSW
jgi:DNA-binding NarL/FixJ family response regulator